MATFYLADIDITAGVLEQLATSAPASLDEAQGWTVDKKASPNYAVYYPDTTRASSAFSSSEPTAFSQYGYRSLSTLTGEFAAGNWVLSFKVKSNAYYAQTGYVKFRLWKSANADGSGATQITPGWQASTLISFSAANQYRTGSITWASGSAVSLTDQYLFLEIEWSCNASGGNNSANVYWVHNEGSAEKLETPAFAGLVTGTLAGTLNNVTGSIAGAQGAAGTVAGFLTPVTAALNGNVQAQGDLAGALSNVTGNFAGNHGVAGPISGLLTAVNGALAGAHGAAGTLAGNLAAISGIIAGAHGVAGVTAGMLGNLQAEIIAYVFGDVEGMIAGILSNPQAEIAGCVSPIGTTTATLDNITASMAGSFEHLGSARWQTPTFFSEYGFGYGDYDPGMAASIAIGCIYIYLKNGDSRAGAWARRILDDLRLHRWDPDFGGYRSDYHYSWLNALALRAFGLAANGIAGMLYRFPAIPQDQAHFDAMMAWVLAHAGDAKPNMLNADLIPFYYGEAVDVWDYAPNYLAMRQMGTLEAVVIMLGAALEYGKSRHNWDWWERLLRFVVRDNLALLSASQIRSLTTTYEPAGQQNLVRVLYADYDRDNTKYAQARDEAAIVRWGEQALDLDCRYGAPVVLEDPALAQLLASRLLPRLTTPMELLEVETWLEGARLELGDTVAVSSDFHGLDQARFTVRGKDLDLGRRSVQLSLNRPLDLSRAWAGDAPGSPEDAWAIDRDSSYDANWNYRAYVY